MYEYYCVLSVCFASKSDFKFLCFILTIGFIFLIIGVFNIIGSITKEYRGQIEYLKNNCTHGPKPPPSIRSSTDREIRKYKR